MSFSQNFIERVREASNIVEEIGQYTQLKRSGTARLMGLCPFPDHNEKSPSFSVSEDRQLYHCFGCGKGGNIYTFLQTYRGMSFPEAVEYLADRAGIAIEKEKTSPQRQEQKQQYKDEKKSLLKLNQLTSEYYHFLLKKMPADHEYRKYIQSRKLSPEVIELFRLGVAPNKWEALADVFKKRSVPFAQGEKLGLLKKRNKGDGHFDMFRERLIFPILSPSGEVLGFGGRALGDEPPKYLNSPETPVFNKGKTFYGLHETAKHIRIEDQVIIVEGYMDLLSLYVAGIKNVVAVLGTALTEDHARLLKRYTKNVVVLFDGDDAGRRAAERSLSILLSQELLPKEVVLPGGQDPDDFIKAQGIDAMKNQIAKAPEFYTSFLDRCLRENGSGAMDKVKTVDQVGPVLLKVADSRLRSLYFRETLDRLGVDENWLRSALKGLQSSAASTEGAKGPSKGPKPPQGMSPQVRETQEKKWSLQSLPKAELQLLQVALKSESYWKQVNERGEVQEMTPLSQEIFAWLNESYRQGPDAFARLPALLVSRVEAANFVTMTVNSSGDGAGEKSPEESDQKLINDCLKWINGRFLRAKAKELANQMQGQPTPEQLEQFMNVQKRKRSLSAEKETETE